MSVNGLGGYIDKSGAFGIKPQFEVARRFSNGLALVKNKKELFYIDKTGKPAFSMKFNGGRDFRDGYALVWIGEKQAISIRRETSPGSRKVSHPSACCTFLPAFELYSHSGWWSAFPAFSPAVPHKILIRHYSCDRANRPHAH